MSYLDTLDRVTLPDGRRLVAASFRGVPFFVAEASRSGGRRVAIHEFPFRDSIAVEDLGRQARPLSVEAYVLGTDYRAQRDALLEALEDTAGGGLLVHPYYGRRQVMCSSLRVREVVGEGGRATFSLELIDVVDPVTPVATIDLDAAAIETARAVEATVSANANEVVRVDGQPGYIFDGLETEYEDLVIAIAEQLEPLAVAEQEAARLLVAVAAATSETAALVRQPAASVARLLALTELIESAIATAPERVWPALLSILDVPEALDVEPTTDTLQTQQTNQDTMSRAWRTAIVARATDTLLATTYSSFEESIAARTSILDDLSRLEADANDVVYAAIVELRAAVAKALPGDRALQRELVRQQPTDIPSLVLSQQIYGSAGRSDDIEARNNVQHPLFISGTLEILSG